MPDNKTLNALIGLLDEPDELAYGVIRDRILLVGQEALAPLERNLEFSFDPVVVERTRWITRKLRQEGLLGELTDWIANGSSDLLRGFILVARSRHPELDEKELVTRLEQIRIDIWIELNENLTALESVRVINHILFDIHHFEGNRDDLAAPGNSYLDTLLETRKGSPLSLGMLYVILARRVGLPIYGVNLPQHFILAYMAPGGPDEPTEEDVLFYINPFNRGAVFTRREIELFIGQMKVTPERSFFLPCANTEIVKRLIGNLIFGYNKAGSTERVEDLENLLTAFE